MKLCEQEAKQYYRIFWPLLVYVNDKLKITPDFNDDVSKDKVSIKKACPIRDKLWSDSSFLESFAAENPAGLSSEDLEIVLSWKYRIAGDFFIYKNLAKYSVFLEYKTPARAFGVCGLKSTISEITCSSPPVFVKSILLPFKDKIVIDGIMGGYDFSFGSGYKSNLDKAYRNAKETKGIITSLIPEKINEEFHKNFDKRNNLLLKAFGKHLLKSGLSEKTVKQHTANIETFCRDFLMRLDPPDQLINTGYADIIDYMDKIPVDSKDRNAHVVSFKRFTRFLAETERMDSGEYWDIFYMLKKYRD